jgi:hypothetical protein
MEAQQKIFFTLKEVGDHYGFSIAKAYKLSQE